MIYLGIRNTYTMRPILENIPLKKTHLYKPFHIEKDFQSEIFWYLRDRGIYIHRIPDLGPASRLVDAIMIDHEGKTFYVEFKKITDYTYNMSDFQPAQIRFFEMAMVRNVESYVIVYSQKAKTYWVWSYQYLKENQSKTRGIKLFTPLKNKNT